MKYDRADDFHFVFEPSGIPFRSKIKGNNSTQNYLYSEIDFIFVTNCRYDYIPLNFIEVQ